MTDEDEHLLIENFANAAEKLPLAARFRLAEALVSDHGGSLALSSQNPYLCAASKILEDAIAVLEQKHPRAARSEVRPWECNGEQRAGRRPKPPSSEPV